MKTLISPNIIKKHTPSLQGVPGELLCGALDTYIYKCLTECFGEPFYRFLIKEINDYSDACEYAESEKYDTSEYVIYNSCIRVSLCDQNTANPNDNLKWKDGLDFDVPCLQELWDVFLCRWLSLHVVCNSLTYDIWKKFCGENNNNVKEYDIIIRQYEYEVKHLFDCIYMYIKNRVNVDCPHSSESENCNIDWSIIDWVGDACKKPCCGNANNFGNGRVAFYE